MHVVVCVCVYFVSSFVSSSVRSICIYVGGFLSLLFLYFSIYVSPSVLSLLIDFFIASRRSFCLYVCLYFVSLFSYCVM